MAMKETSGFPSPAGCREELLDPANLGSMTAADHDVFGKLIGYLGFSHRGVFIGEGASSEVDRGGLTHRGRGQGLGRVALLCGRPVAPLYLLFGSLEASVNFWMSMWGPQITHPEYPICIQFTIP
jgi:hypothetical protein